MPEAAASGALTPDVAVDYLRDLSTDIRAAVVLGADGALLAGDAALAAPARRMLAACDAALLEVETARGSVVLARSATHALGVVVGRLALPALVRYDVRRVLGDLAPAARKAS